MTTIRKLGTVLGVALLILILPGSVVLVISGHVPHWFAALEVVAAVLFLIGGAIVLVADVIIRRHRRRSVGTTPHVSCAEPTTAVRSRPSRTRDGT